MAQPSIRALDAPEIAALHKYFRAVSDNLAGQLRTSMSEPTISEILCNTLSDGGSRLYGLSYPLAELRKDLEALGNVLDFDITLRSHPQSTRFEGKVSHSDVGIVFTRKAGGIIETPTALLFQAKKLYGADRSFLVDSEYEEFKLDQLSNLESVRDRCGGRGGIFYVFYNPELDGFYPPEHDKIAALERPFLARDVGGLYMARDPSWKPSFDELKQRPGIRVSDLEHVRSVNPKEGKLTLRQMYTNTDPALGLSKGCSFETFADFMVYGVLARAVGKANGRLRSLAEGRKPGARSADESLAEEPIKPAKHTLTINLNTLRKD